MAAGQPLGAFVAAIVDERFLQTAEARAGIRRAVFDAERLDDVHHEVRAGLLVAGNFDRAAGFSGRPLLGLLRHDDRRRGETRGTGSGAFQETTSANRSF